MFLFSLLLRRWRPEKVLFSLLYSLYRDERRGPFSVRIIGEQVLLAVFFPVGCTPVTSLFPFPACKGLLPISGALNVARW